MVYDHANRLSHMVQPEGIVTNDNGTFMYRYFKTDHLGSTRAVLAAIAGTMIVDQSTDYYPFGLAWSTDNLHLNKYLFSGKELQDGDMSPNILGWYDFGSRYYNPVYGRWFNVDPALQLANPYLYCANSPLMFVDPNGEFFWTIFTAIWDFIDTAFFDGGLDFTNSSSMRNAWGDFDPTRKGSKTNNAWQIDKGLFRGDFGQILSRFTWEFPQTFVGYFAAGGYNVGGGVKSVSHYGGATAVEAYSSGWGGFTLGSYILGEEGLYADPSNDLFQHEYGHYLQSQASGPLYLAKYAIPSLYDAASGEKGTHAYHPVEQDANMRALKYFEKKYPGFADARIKETDEYGWDHRKNPIVGYNLNREGGYHNIENQIALKFAKIPAYGYGFLDVLNSVFSFGLLPLQTFIMALPYDFVYRANKEINVKLDLITR